MPIRLADLVENDSEYRQGDRVIVTVLDDKGGGIGLFDFESDADAMVDLFMMLRAIARANGKDLEYVNIPDSPGDME